MKTLSQLAPKIVEKESGKEISFAQFLEEQSGMGELYEPEIGEMLAAALNPHTSWFDALDYLVPIARGIISEAVQLDDKRIYLRLVLAIREAWQDLNPNVQGKASTDDGYSLDEDVISE